TKCCRDPSRDVVVSNCIEAVGPASRPPANSVLMRPIGQMGRKSSPTLWSVAADVLGLGTVLRFLLIGPVVTLDIFFWLEHVFASACAWSLMAGLSLRARWCCHEFSFPCVVPGGARVRTESRAARVILKSLFAIELITSSFVVEAK